MTVIERMVNSLAILADAYMFESAVSDNIKTIDAVIAKADAVNECIELLDEINAEYETN